MDYEHLNLLVELINNFNMDIEKSTLKGKAVQLVIYNTSDEFIRLRIRLTDACCERDDYIKAYTDLRVLLNRQFTLDKIKSDKIDELSDKLNTANSINVKLNDICNQFAIDSEENEKELNAKNHSFEVVARSVDRLEKRITEYKEQEKTLIENIHKLEDFNKKNSIHKFIIKLKSLFKQ